VALSADEFPPGIDTEQDLARAEAYLRAPASTLDLGARRVRQLTSVNRTS